MVVKEENGEITISERLHVGIHGEGKCLTRKKEGCDHERKYLMPMELFGEREEEIEATDF